MNEYQQEKQKKSEQLAYDISDSLNKGALDYPHFAERVQRDHRTLQQMMMRLFWGCIVKWAEADKAGHSDARNEATTKLCRRIVDAVGAEQHFPLI